MLPETAIPAAYFITFNCYGTWLHGEKPTSVDRFNNIPGTDFLPLSSKRAQLARKQMLETPYCLDEHRRHIVLQAIIDVCDYRQWVLLAAYASRYLNRSNLDGNRVNRWARHGSTQYLWEESAIEAAIKYVVHEQGFPMAVFENVNRMFREVI